MQYTIGMDIGTSATKTALFDITGNMVASFSREYPLSQPQNGWAEQNPEDWYQAAVQTLQQVVQTSGVDKSQIAGIGLSGQMHGLTAVDREENPVCPAIIWMDQRATGELGEIREKISAGEQGRILHNRVFNGFAMAS